MNLHNRKGIRFSYKYRRRAVGHDTETTGFKDPSNTIKTTLQTNATHHRLMIYPSISILAGQEND